MTPNAWNYVAFTFDGSTINFYVNGQAAGSVPGSLYDYGLATADIGGNTIGGTTTKGFFNGNIDELTIYNRALTPAEIATIYAEGSAGKPVFGNAGDGVRIEAGAAKNTVGGFTAGAGNVISGNVADGIGLTDSGTSVNVIAGNIIGLNAAGNAVAPNGGSGVNIFAGAANNYIGYSPNSIFVASYNSDTVQQYDSNTGRSDGAFVSLGSGGLVNPVDPIIGPDGNLYVSSKTDGNVLRFDGRTGAFLEVFVTSGPASAAIAPDGITFGPDGDLYVVDDISGNVLRYDGTTGAFLGVFAVGSPGAGGDLVFGTNGHLYVDSNSNNLIEEFDSTGAFVRSLGSGTNLTNPTGLAFGPDGLLDVASSGNDEILRFNATTGAFVDTFAAGEALDYPIGLEFGPDGNLYASNGNIDTVVRYDATGNFLGTVVVTGSGGLDGAQYFTFANAYAANVISGNLGYGVSISDAATSGNIVAGNDIGTCPNGTTASGISNTPLGNRLSGVLLLNSTHDNLIGSDGANPNGTFMGNVISGNRADGVDVIAGANHNIVAGNSIGTTISGGEGLGNAGFGVGLFDQTTDNTVGGTVPAQRNVISANEFGVAIIGSGGPVSGNLVIGNYIGTDATGEAPVGNNIAGVAISQGATDNSIGGSAAGERNVISGNTNFDVAIINTGTTGNVVAGNLIGTDVTGTSSLSAGSQNNLVGIFLGASGNTLGGPAAADRNVISGAPIFSGVAVSDGAHDNTVEGNYIGTDVSGTSAIPNVVGIDVFNSETASPDNHTVNNLIQGNLISGNTADGVRIEQMNTTGNQVLDNRIGTTFDGSAALANGGNGVVIDLGATNNVIGAGNLISGNGTNGIDITDSATTGNIVVGNFIGPDVTGSTHLANQGVGVLITNSSANTVGGTTAAARNIVSGNHTEGVSVVGTQAVGNVVEGNYIGTDATGTQSVPNGSEGVSVGDARETIIGGLTPGARNIISGGGRDGIGIGGVFEVGTQVLGNWIGLDVNGNTLHNALTGVYVNFGRDNLIAGNVISGNHASGIQLDNRASGNVIQANFIGTDPTGTTNVDHLGHTLGNSADGVLIDNQSTANTVGGATAATRNVISGNLGNGVEIGDSGTSGNLVAGNIIGLDASGSTAVGANGNTLGNGNEGVAINVGATDNTVGGLTSIPGTGAGNVISGNVGTNTIVNSGYGVRIFGSGTSGNIVEGNLIGLDETGTKVNDSHGHALGNLAGVGIDSGATNNTVGGTAAGARNIISGAFGGLNTNVYLHDSGTSANVVAGNYIGTDITGTVGLNGGAFGVTINGGATSDTIGGTTTAALNVIVGGVALGDSGTSGHLIEGNYIGTNASGTAALGNGNSGIYFHDGAAGNTVGGTAAGARNVISGNGTAGVVLTDTSANVIEGNFIGTDATGTAPVSNVGDGVQILNGSTGNVIGGTAPGAGNVISANRGDSGGVVVVASSGNLVEGNYIGTDVHGTTAMGNLGDGVVLASGATGNTVGGTAAGAGNVISGTTASFTSNTIAGVAITDAGTSGNLFAGNFIGTNAAGTAALANKAGVVIEGGAANNTIGGSTAAANVISGNTNDGIDVTDSGTSGNLVAGNLIGTNATGARPLGNGGAGVSISSGAQNNFVGFDSVSATPTGQGNVIAANTGDGISITGATTTGNTVRGNAIYANGGISIDLGGTGNNNQTFPVLLTFTPGVPTVVTGTFQSTASHQYVLDFYANVAATPGGSIGNQVYLGALHITTDSSGGYVIDDDMLPSTLPSVTVTVTATDVTTGVDFGDTSAFASAIGDPNYHDIPPLIAISGPTTAIAGTTLSMTSILTRAHSDTDTTKTYNYAWTVTQAGNPTFTLPADTATDGPSLVFIPPTLGTYGISLTVTDSNGGTATAIPITVFVGVPGPGVVIQNAPATGSAGKPVPLTGTLTGVVSEPTGAVTTSLAWSVTRNGQPFALPTGTITNTANFAFTPTDGGLFAVTLAAADSAGGVGSATVFIQVSGAVAPTAVILGAPSRGQKGTPITLAAAGDLNLTGPFTYDWTVTGPLGSFSVPNDKTGTITFTPATAGTYTVDLIVTDSQGDQSSAPTVTIQVADVAPTATILSSPLSATVGQLVMLTGTGSEDATLSWSVFSSGAGKVIATGTGSSFTYSPSAGGVDVVTLTATNGSTPPLSGSTSVVFPVNQAANAITLTGSNFQVGSIPQVTATVSVPSAESYQYSWSVIGQASAFSTSGSSPGFVGSSYTFGFPAPGSNLTLNPGPYLVSVTATGSDGSVVAGAQVFTVAPGPVPVAIIGPTTGQEGTPITLSDPASDPNLSGLLTYVWSVTGPHGFSAAQSNAGNTFTFTPPNKGNFDVSLTVHDTRDGTIGSASTVIAVAAVPPTANILSVSGQTTLGQTITLQGAGSQGTTLSWSVFSSGAGKVIATGSGASFQYKATAVGADMVTLTATETDLDDETTATGSTSVTLPIGQGTTTLTLGLTPGEASLLEATPGSVLATVNSPPTGVMYQFTWSVRAEGNSFTANSSGASAPATQIEIDFTPPEPGPYVVSVTATPTDSAQPTLTATRVFQAADVAPTVGAIQVVQLPAGATTPIVVDPSDSSTFPYEGAAITFSAPVSDPGVTNGTDVLRYLWTVSGPDGFGLVRTTPQLTFTPIEFGPYSVQLTVTDDSGDTGTNSVNVTVLHVQPVPTILDSVAGTFIGESSFTINLTASVPDPGADDLFTYLWSVTSSDKSVGVQFPSNNGPNFTFSGQLGVNYFITLTVTDNDGGSGTATTQLLIAQPGQTLVLQYGQNVPTGTTQVLAIAAGGATIDASALPNTVSVVETAVGGHDTLIGGAGPTYLQGDSSFNSLVAGTGNDTMVAQLGDTLIGGGATGQTNLYLVNAVGQQVVQAKGQANTLSFAPSATGVNVKLGNGTVTNSQNNTLVNLSGSVQMVIGGQGNDTLDAGSVSNVNLVSGSRAASTTALTVPADNLENPFFSATVAANGPGSATPTGSVDFFDTTSGIDLGRVQIAGGIATLNFPSGMFVPGDTVIATYSGDTQFAPSTATRTLNSLRVGSGQTASTSTGLTSSPSADGTSITFTAVVQNPFGPTPRGTVAFLDATTNTPLGSVALTGDTAILPVSGAATLAGHTITASYLGNTSLSPSSASQTLGSAALLMTGGGHSITLFGGSGSDSLSASGGSSITLMGGSGNDTLSAIGGASGIVMQGGTGNAVLNASGATSISMFGGTGNDMLTSTGGASITMMGGAGNSTLLSSGGSNLMMLSGSGNAASITMFGSAGQDSLASSGGSFVTMIGGAGNDMLSANNVNNLVQQAGNGTQALNVTGGTSITMFGSAGNDRLSATGSMNDRTLVPVSGVVMIGGTGSVNMSVSLGSSVSMFGGSGNDSLSATGGSGVTMQGGLGNDTLSANGVANLLQQSNSSTGNLLTVTGGSSITMFGGAGNDRLSATGSNGDNGVPVSGVVMIGGTGNANLSLSLGSSITMFGGTGNDSLTASGGSNISMLGGTGNDILSVSNSSLVSMLGGSGNSTLAAGSGAASITMFGGTGNDSLQSSAGANSITMIGGMGNSTLTASGASNVLMAAGTSPGSATVSLTNGTSITMFGASGADSITSSGGSNITMIGGTGNDTLISTGDSNALMLAGAGTVAAPTNDGSSVTLFNGAGNDSLSSSGGNSVTMQGGTGNSTLTAASGATVVMIAGSGNSTLAASGGTSITMFGGTGNDSFASSSGNNITMQGGSGSATMAATNGNTVFIGGGSANSTLSSSGGTSVTMFGGTGNDSLHSSGGTGITMSGGTGNDTLSAVNAATASLLGGSGNSTLSTSGGTSVTMFGGSGNDSLRSSAGTSIAMVGGTGDDTLTAFSGNSLTMLGGTGPVSMQASGSNNVSMQGGSGDATMGATGGTSITMFGGTGNDSLSSSGGNNVTMIGGTGINTLSAVNGSGITMLGETGTNSATVMASGGSSITMFGGTGNDSLSSSGGSTISMVGGTGNDILSVSGSSVVTMVGGSGNSTLSASNGAASITMFGGTGNDSLHTSGGSSITMIGGSGNSTLTASGASNVLMAAGTNPNSATVGLTNGTSVTMFGASGNDSIVSSGGSNITMIGGTGNDTLTAVNGSNVLMLVGVGTTAAPTSDGSSVTLFNGGGNDSLQSSGGSSITMQGGTGNDTLAGVNVTGLLVLGGSGNASLSGTGGSSITLFGGTGNATLTSSGGSSVTMIGGSGNDSVTSSNGTGIVMQGGPGNSTLTATGGSSITMFSGTGQATLTASGAASLTMIGGNGNDLLSSTDSSAVSMQGGSGDSTLVSSSGSSVTMLGGTGDDSLQSSGGTGVTMIGGTGDDTLSATAGSGALVFGGSGSDMLSATGSNNITLFAGTGNSSLTSFKNTSVTVVGGSGNDLLTSSGDVQVSMLGGTGNSTLISSGGSSMTMLGGTGNDSLESSGGVSMTMQGGTGTDMVSATNASGSLIIGGQGNDSVSSTGGTNVTVYGGTGNDSISSFNQSGGSVIGGTGNDTITSAGDSDLTLMGGGSGSVFQQETGDTNVTVLGGGGNDTLSAIGGTNIALYGLAGNNTYLISATTSNPLTASVNTLATFGQQQPQTDGQTTAVNTLQFAGITVGININLGNTSNGAVPVDTTDPGQPQTVTPFITLSLTGEFQKVIGGSGSDTIVAGSGPTTLVAGSGDDSLVAGSGGTTFQFPGTNFHTVTIDPPVGSGLNTLDFSQFGGPVTLNLGLANQAQTVSPGVSGLALILQPPAGQTVPDINGYIASAYDDQIIGNGNGDSFFIGQAADLGVSSATVAAGQGATTTVLTSGLSSDGLSATLTATVSALSSGAGTPSGLVLFQDTTTNTILGVAPLIAGVAISDSISVALVGGHTIIAVYFPTTTTFAASSAEQILGPLATTTALTASTSLTGQTTTLTATVSADSAGSTPTGSVDFFDRTTNTDLGSVPLNDGVATTTAGTTSVAGHTITATYMRPGNRTFTGGGGSDAFYFSGSEPGTATLVEGATGNTLNFYGFGGPINVNLSPAEAEKTQTVGTSYGSSLSLKLSNPSAFSAVVGTPYADTIQGSNAANATIIGGGGQDNLLAGTGSNFVQGNVTQIVYLSFPPAAQTPPGDHVYTTAEQNAILQGLQQIYADFDYAFTLDPTVAANLAQITGGAYVTLLFDGNVSGGGGEASELDVNNLDLGGSANIDIASFLGDASLGLVLPTSANIIGLTTTIAAHELGHLSGLQHQDAIGPIGSGIFSGMDPANFFPAYTGPTDANETPQDIMASPSSVGSTLQDAANGTYLGERDAITLAFNDTGNVLAQQDLATQSVSPSTGQVQLPSTAYTVPMQSLAVPNTLLSSSARDYGLTFDVTAAAVNGTLRTPGQADFYAIQGTAGQVVTFLVISNNMTLNPRPFNPELVVTDASGNVLDYPGNTNTNLPAPFLSGAYNLHEFESNDSTLLDVTLPADGTYYVGIDASPLTPLATGNYQLFAYSFATGTGPSGAGGDTMVAGSGNDTMLGSSGNDLFLFPGGLSGQATVNAASGHDLADARQSPNEQITTIGDVTVLQNQGSPTTTVVQSSLPTSIYGQNVTFTATVTAQDSTTPTGTVQFYIDGTAFGSAVTLQDNGQAISGIANATSTPALTATQHSITAVFSSSSNAYGSSNDNDNPFTQTVQQASTQTAVSSSASPSSYGQTISFAATVSNSSGTSATPTGSVQFYIDGNAFGSAVDLDSNGKATSASISTLSATSHSITAVYTNTDGNFSGSDNSAAPFSQTVSKASTQTVVSSSLNPSPYGQAISFAATVSNTSDSSATPTGSVTFFIDGNAFGSAVNLDSNGKATSAPISTLSATSHSITAVYTNSDGNFSGSDNKASPLTQNVNKAGTQTIVSSSANPSTYGQTISFAATVSNTSGTSATPTGSVQFFIDGNAFGSAVNLDGNGKATSASISTLSATSHSITAVYTNTDGNFSGSDNSAAPFSQTVSKASTQTVVSSSLNPSPYGQAISFAATVSNTSGTSATPTGSVQFFIDGNAFGSAVNLDSNGKATSAPISTLSAPSHSITAVYTNSDGNFSDSDNKASPLTQNISKASPSFSHLTPSQTITAGTASINLSGVLSAGSLVPTGELITITAGSASTTATVNADGSFSATLNTSGLAASTGSYTITYNYAGDTNFHSTNDNSTSLTVNPGGPTDVTSKVSVTLGGMQLVFGSNKNSKYNYVQTVTIKNTSSATINGPLYYEVIGLANATLFNGNGTSQKIHPGVPYILVSSGSLAAGASVTVNLQFYDPPPNVIPSYTSYAVVSGGTP